ncbi:MAG: single-stranded-DNA-specific exonuclease RecJ [Nitrospinae bacterium]|nr:single-stranded-DNA-specific exonuclease RecJ [Nitrospinota bacterium]
MKGKDWIIHPGSPEAESNISSALNLHPVISRLLVNRGVSTPEDARLYLEGGLDSLHDPFTMAGMREAVDRVITAKAGGEKIVIYGDYDADGVTATALLLSFFRQTGFNASYYIPERLTEGYGLNTEALDSIKADGAGLVITVDNGVNALDAISHAGSLGLDVIVTDHHKPGDALPSAIAVLNPNRADCPYPCKELAGVGVAFKLITALRSELHKRGVAKDKLPVLRRLLDLVAIGSIGDCSALKGENRLLARHGLTELSATTRLGLSALKETCGVNGSVSSREVSFALVPRLNAAGRMGKADIGLELLLAGDIVEGKKIAIALDDENKRRQDLQADTLAEALQAVETSLDPMRDRVIIIGSENWSPGVAGLVASKLVEKFGLPSAVVCFEGDFGKGSARSLPGFDITEALGKVTAGVVRFGGHKMAAGFTIRRNEYEAFRESLLAIVSQTLKPEGARPRIMIDLETEPALVNKDLLTRIKVLEPFGEGNPTPVFMSSGVSFASSTVVGKDGRHTRLTLRDGTQIMGFNMAERLSGADMRSGRYDIVYTAEISVWKETARVQFNLLDFRVCAE